MLKNWRSWVLAALFLGPFVAYIGLGLLWLRERGWLWVLAASVASVASGVVFTLLASRWTKARREFLPPIDWEVPGTFSDFDRQAWSLVEAEAERGDSLAMADLTRFDTYVETGRHLASRLAAHYHPLTSDPIEHVAVVELITALELAAEDLAGLCRQIPGGDLVTPADWKRAVVAAGYLQKASDLYTYLLPVINPMVGIPRLASQHLMVKPAWKNMQQNVLRWFFRAFVNRLGTHLVELYSGRLVIGADRYRKLTRKSIGFRLEADAALGTLTVAIAGGKSVARTRLAAALRQTLAGDATKFRDEILVSHGEEAGLDLLRKARLVEVEPYSSSPGGHESARDRSTRRHAVEQAVEADLLIVVIDPAAASQHADAAFLTAWSQWYHDHPGLAIPPALAVGASADAAWLGATRSALPSVVTEVVGLDLGADASQTSLSNLLGPLSRLAHRAERNALIRQLRDASARSRAGRLFRQVGQHGRSLWKTLQERRKTPTSTES